MALTPLAPLAPFSQVESGMVESLKETVMQGVTTYPATPRERWVLEWPGQGVLVVTAVFWTQEVALAIASGAQGALQQCAEANTQQLNSVVNLVRGQLTKLNRATLSSLVGAAALGATCTGQGGGVWGDSRAWL